MAVVPVDEIGDIEREALPGRSNPRFDDTANPQAFGAGLGQGIQSAASDVAQVQQARQRKANEDEDRVRLAGAITTLSQKANAHLYGTDLGDPNAAPDDNAAFRQTGASIVDMPERYGAQFDQDAQDISSQLTPHQQSMFAERITDERNRFDLEVRRYQFQQSNREAEQTFANAKTQAIQNASLGYRDPDAITQAREDIFNAGMALAYRGGKDQIQAYKQSGYAQDLDALHTGVVDAYIADGNALGAYQYLDQWKGDLSSGAVQERLMNGIKVAGARQLSDGVVNTYRAQGPAAGTQQLARINSLPLPDDVKDQARSDIERGLSQWHAEQRQTNANAIIGLETRLGSNQTSPADRATVWNLYHSGALTVDQTGETLGRIERAQLAQADADATNATAMKAYQNGHALDPKDKDVRDGISSVFTSYTKDVDPGSAEWINRGADIASKTGVTPDPVVTWARTNLVSGDPKTAAQAAQAIERMASANPRGTPYALDDKEKVMARQINDAVTAGTDPIAAVEMARQLARMTDGEKERLNQVYEQKQYAKNSSGDLGSALKSQPQYKAGFFNSIPTPPAEMVGQFEQLRRDYFKMTGGNKDQADSLAMNDLKNTWGVSSVNGERELMKYAPEALNPGLTTQALRTDIESSVKGRTADPTKVRLIATPDTENTGGQIWALGVPNQFGAYDVMRDDKNRVIQYQLPTAAAAFKETQAKAAAAGMAEAKRKQETARVREQAEWDALGGAQAAQGRTGVLGY